ncbi:3-keto-5-aminohexanoate cleavage protein [Natrialbaceae archaeon A-CW1-1]
MTKTWLEVAINGPWNRQQQPNVPVTPEECIADAVDCVEAGAAIVHVHARCRESGEQYDDPDLYTEIIEGIQDQVDAIVYPTTPQSGALGQPERTGEERFAHHDILGNREILEWSVIDPGSTNFVGYHALTCGESGFVYKNPIEDIRIGLEIAERHNSTPSYAIYEPGFLRLGGALAKQYEVPGPIYRFMFSEKYAVGYPPKRYALDSYLSLLEEEASGAPWMIAGLGVNVTPLIEYTVEQGGHIRVGLEDTPFGSERNNVDWVKFARRKVTKAGGELASAEEIRQSLKRQI